MEGPFLKCFMADVEQFVKGKLLGDCSARGINGQIMSRAGEFHKCIFW